MRGLNTPIWQLTVGEFLDMQQQHIELYGKPINEEEPPCNDKRFVYGISGLAELLNCSKATAQRIKNIGVIDKAIIQFGRKITIDADLALELIQKYNKNLKR